MLVSFTLNALMHACAPSIGPRTLAAVIAYESAGRPDAIGDNSTRRAYFPASRAAAEDLALRLTGLGHDLDLGLMQLNARNLPRLHVSLHSAFDPCTNLAAGGRILGEDYARAARRFGRGQRALYYALSAYNTGGFWAGSGYAHGVYESARQLRFEGPR
jgi:type IV secretion system protein VirB1